MVDALLLVRDKVRRVSPTIPRIDNRILDGKQMILVTGHRRESFGGPLREFCLALRDIVRAHLNTCLIYPVHLNPNVQKPVHEILGREERVHLIPPVEYPSFVYLMDRSHLIITDSGGIQEEAPSLRKPVLVTREVTERQEAVEAGLSELVGTDREGIFRAAHRLLTDEERYARMSTGSNPYGDGRASERIVKILLDG